VWSVVNAILNKDIDCEGGSENAWRLDYWWRECLGTGWW
jgi:hypothetical protein